MATREEYLDCYRQITKNIITRYTDGKISMGATLKLIDIYTQVVTELMPPNKSLHWKTKARLFLKRLSQRIKL